MTKKFLLTTRKDGLPMLVNFDSIKWIKPFLGSREDDGAYSVIHLDKNEELVVEGKFNVLIQRIIEG